MNSDLFCIAPIVDYTDTPVMVRGHGCYVYDEDGNTYLDINCGQFSAIFGHSSHVVNKVLEYSKDNLIHLNSGLISQNFIDAAKKLHTLMPEMDSKIVLLSTGGEANECCLRYAKHMNHDKPGIISFAEGYHGLTHGTEGYSINRKWVKPTLMYSLSVHAPQVMADGVFDYAPFIEEFRDIARKNRDVVAAALFEPIVSNGGLFYPQKEYWQEIRKICDENDIYLIFDECQTGFGRTGTWFCYQQLGCVPDMLVSAKGMGLGFPVSMVAFNGNRFRNEDFGMHHFSSHQNEPFSSELILQAIKAIEEQGLLRNIAETGTYLVEQLKGLETEIDILTDARGKGLMCGVNLKEYSYSKEKLAKRTEDLTSLARKRGLLLQLTNFGRTVRILPAYTTTKEDIDVFIRLLSLSLNDLGDLGYQIFASGSNP